jgi:hypothetical protein
LPAMAVLAPITRAKMMIIEVKRVFPVCMCSSAFINMVVPVAQMPVLEFVYSHYIG